MMTLDGPLELLNQLVLLALALALELVLALALAVPEQLEEVLVQVPVQQGVLHSIEPTVLAVVSFPFPEPPTYAVDWRP